jgi:hypothetical protein
MVEIRITFDDSDLFKYDANNAKCKECWGGWVETQCESEDIPCEKYHVGCTECLEDMCIDAINNGICLRGLTPKKERRYHLEAS